MIMMLRVTYLGLYRRINFLFYIIRKGKGNNLLLCIVFIIVGLVYQVNNFLFLHYKKKLGNKIAFWNYYFFFTVWKNINAKHEKRKIFFLAFNDVLVSQESKVNRQKEIMSLFKKFDYNRITILNKARGIKLEVPNIDSTILQN